MSSSTVKRVVVYRFERQPLEVFVKPATYLLDSGIEFLTVGGALQTLPYSDTKAVCFGDSARFDLFTSHSVFERRPRLSGLWARFTLKDGDRIDGVLPSNLAEWPKAGFSFTPPRMSSQRQKVFLPREAVVSVELHGLIGSMAHKLRPGGKARDTQLEMFD